MTATRVERGRIRYLTPGHPRPVEAAQDSLVLHLHLKNISEDVIFCPTDPYFDRRCKPKQTQNKTYTYLVMSGQRYYGGPCDWKPTPPREYVLGQVYGKELKPQQALDTIVCTAPEDDAGRALEQYHGDLLWRVQLRRGLVQVGDRELSATAVIGVQFNKKDVQPMAKSELAGEPTISARNLLRAFAEAN